MGFFSDLFESDSQTNTSQTYSETTEQTQRRDPYAPATDAINNLLRQITDMTGEQFEPFSGDRVADLTPEQIAGLDAVLEFAGGRGADIATGMSDAGMDLLGGVEGDMGLARGAYGDLLSLAESAPIESGRVDLDYASSIAQNPYLDEMIDASLRDASRNFSENVLPGVALSSAASGNLGSSRRGAYEAIAQRGEMDRAADVAAGMRYDAYRTGLGLAENEVGRNFQGAMAGRQQELQALLQAAGGYQGLAAMGLTGADLAAMGFNMEASLPGMVSGVGDVYQRQNQAEIGGQMQAYSEGQFLPMQAAANLMDIAMAPALNFGTQSMSSFTEGESTTTQETTERPSPFQRIGQVAQLAGQVAGMPNPFASTGGTANAASAAQVGQDFWGGMPRGAFYSPAIPGYG
jgi:hypothetical protein